MSYVKRSDPSYSLNEFILEWMGPCHWSELCRGISGDKEYLNSSDPLIQAEISLRQLPEQDHQDWLRRPAVGVLLHCWTRWGPCMDHSGKSQLPVVHIHAESVRVCTTCTHTHTQRNTHSVPRSTLLAPSLISHTFNLVSTCHGCALASHYRPRITSITGELLNSESGGYIDWGGQQLILPITSMRMFPSCADLPALLLPLEIRSLCIVPA